MSIKIKVLYAALIALAIYTLWPSNSTQDNSATIRIWDAHINEQGHLNVLGVVLGETTLKQAEELLHTQSERALFISLKEGQPQKETLEAYFPTSPDRSKIVIELDANPDLLTRIKGNAYNPMAFPSGNAKLEIASEHNAEINTQIVKSLTYIPPLNLTPDMVEQHFGKTTQQIVDNNSNIHLLYPALGLDVVIAQEGNPLLQFVPPAEFERLLTLLKQQDKKETAQ
jgi:hypothetical protein